MFIELTSKGTDTKVSLNVNLIISIVKSAEGASIIRTIDGKVLWVQESYEKVMKEVRSFKSAVKIQNKYIIKEDDI